LRYNERVGRKGFVALVMLASCADILGIDDGTPRTYDDASIDVSNDVTTFPDVKLDAPVDAAPDVPNSPLPCGDASCNAIVQACCRTGSATLPDAEAFACIADDASCSGLKVTCADSKNCTAQGHPGEECCAVVPDGGTIATSTTCSKTSCGAAGMCQPGDDEICTGDASCKPSVQTIVGWMLCK
jgi:hypothetical protein